VVLECDILQKTLCVEYDILQKTLYVEYDIENILNDGELDVKRTVKDFLPVRQEGNRQVQRNIIHYNLDMVIVCCA